MKPTFSKTDKSSSVYAQQIIMSGLEFSSYPGIGEWAAENLHYSQAVRVGDLIKCSGQGINSLYKASSKNFKKKLISNTLRRLECKKLRNRL
jgi:hypothetical protein